MTGTDRNGTNDDEPLEISDDELAAFAMAADPDAPVPDDAVPFGDRDPSTFPLLPDWYMPAPRGHRNRGRSRSRDAVMLVLAASLVVINVGGFCVTYGFPEFVWG
jgi:hypothetical protein